MIEITLKKHEHIDKALRRLKKALDNEGTIRELKERKFYQKPSEKKRKKSARARSRKK